ELLVAVRREQLATQLAKAYVQEQAAQTKRIDSENAKATADQQATLVTAKINVEASKRKAEAARNEGEGERDKLAAIAEGQKKQMDVLGADATVRLRQFELALNTLVNYFDKHPDVLTAALANANKFVPQVSMGASSGGGLNDVLLALVGQQLAKGSVVPANTGPVAQSPGQQ